MDSNVSNSLKLLSEASESTKRREKEAGLTRAEEDSARMDYFTKATQNALNGLGEELNLKPTGTWGDVRKHLQDTLGSQWTVTPATRYMQDGIDGIGVQAQCDEFSISLCVDQMVRANFAIREFVIEECATYPREPLDLQDFREVLGALLAKVKHLRNLLNSALSEVPG